MSKRVFVMLRSLLAVATLALLQVPSHLGVSAQANCQTYQETGKTVCGRFLEYWNANGGLAQQGYPISAEIQEKSDTDGKTYTVQYFERAVFEMHPENSAPNDVLLSLLGVFRYKEKYPSGATGQTPNNDAGSVLFSETGHKVGGVFLDYWQKNGGLAQQGLPISDEFNETSALDGKTYKVQYFERAVFEYHPENQPPYNVLLSQLGTFRLKAKTTPPTATPTIQPTKVPATPTPQPTTAAGCDPSGSIDGSATPDVAHVGDTITFKAQGFVPGEEVSFWFTQPDGVTFGTARPAIAANRDGTIGPLQLTITQDFADGGSGRWSLVFAGGHTGQGHKSVIYFCLLSSAPTPTACDTTGTIDGSAAPTSGRVGDRIVFRASGFFPGEEASFWLTSPTGDVIGTRRPISGGVGRDGTVVLALTITNQLADVGTGRWAMTIVGGATGQGHKSVIYFCVSR